MFGTRSKNAEELNKIDQAELDLWADIKKNKKLAILIIIASLLFSFIAVGFCFSCLGTIISGEEITLKMILKNSFGNIISYPIAVFFAYVIAKGGYRFYKVSQKNYVKVEEDGESYKRAKETMYGDFQWMPEENRKTAFNRSKDFYKLTDDIIGYDDKGQIYALDFSRPENFGKNRNKIVFGASRSGKSAAIVYNDLIQCFRRGESVITTDSKGDVYRETAAIAKHFGYKIRVLNLKTKELKNSDAWDPMKYVTEEDTIQADVLANTIILNTEGIPKLDYWAKNELNCLKAAILLVALSPEYEGHRSFAEVIDIVSNPGTYNDKFRGLPNDNPAKLAFNIYAACEPKIQGQILNGMAQRLSLLTDRYVKEIVSHDEIDLIAPMKEKCIYYIIISDTDTTMNFVSSMFFTQIFMAQCDYSDYLSKKEKEKQVAVRYELDEFKNIGKIPYFDVKISTFASRKISSTIILQGITQLLDLYPNKNHEIILANTATKILCKAGDMETAKLFEAMCGETTIVVNNARYHKGRAQILDLHNEEGMTEGYGKRPLLPAAKAMQLNKDILVVCIIGEYPIKLKKYITSNLNPVYKEYYEEKEAKRRLPKWRKEKMQAQKEQAKRIEEMNERFQETELPEKEPEEYTNLKKSVKSKNKPKEEDNIQEIAIEPPDAEPPVIEPLPKKRKTVQFDPETGEIFDEPDMDIAETDIKEPEVKNTHNPVIKKPEKEKKFTPIHETEKKKNDNHNLKINESKFNPTTKGSSLLTDLIKKN